MSDNKLSAYSALSALERAKTKMEIEFLVKKISTLLGENPKAFEYSVKSVLEQTLLVVPEYRTLLDEGRVIATARTYSDGAAERLAFGLSFVPDYSENPAQLEDVISKRLLAALEKKNLSSLVNDVTINFMQFRNGKIVAS